MAWNLIKYAVPGYNHADHKEWMIDTKYDKYTVLQDDLQAEEWEADEGEYYLELDCEKDDILGKKLYLYIDGNLVGSDVFSVKGDETCARFVVSANLWMEIYLEDNDSPTFYYCSASDTPLDHSSIEVLMDSTSIPTNLGAPGSVVYTPDLKTIFMVNSSGELVPV